MLGLAKMSQLSSMFLQSLTFERYEVPITIASMRPPLQLGEISMQISSRADAEVVNFVTFARMLQSCACQLEELKGNSDNNYSRIRGHVKAGLRRFV